MFNLLKTKLQPKLKQKKEWKFVIFDLKKFNLLFFEKKKIHKYIFNYNETKEKTKENKEKKHTFIIFMTIR